MHDGNLFSFLAARLQRGCAQRGCAHGQAERVRAVSAGDAREVSPRAAAAALLAAAAAAQPLSSGATVPAAGCCAWPAGGLPSPQLNSEGSAA